MGCKDVNLFLLYESFGCKKLPDVPQYLQLDDWFVLIDSRLG